MIRINYGVIKLACDADKNHEIRSTVTVGELVDWFNEYLKNPSKYVLR
jgi:hypothetical protein